jgi:hypothetical protein
MGRSIAMKTYLATLGSSKVGFTVTRRQSNGQPEYIRGMRGLVERNAMRYYLAIDALPWRICRSSRAATAKAPAKLVHRHRAIPPSTA